MDRVHRAQIRAGQMAAIAVEATEAASHTKAMALGIRTAAHESRDVTRLDKYLTASMKSEGMQVQLRTQAADKMKKEIASLLEKVKAEAKIAAEKAADQALAQVNEEIAETKQKIKEADALITPLPLATISKTMANAAAPFQAAMGRAAGVGAVYSINAQAIAGKAVAMQDTARYLASQANSFQKVGNSKDAQAMLDKASSMISAGKGLMADAGRFQDMAQYVQDSIPKYQYAGQMAMYRASALEDRGVPPPPI